MKHYTIVHPSFDPPTGKTRKLLQELLERREDMEGGKEILGIIDLLSHEKNLPFVNYLSIEKGKIIQLCQEFLKFLCSFPGWDKTPQFACGIQSATAGITAALMANDINSGEVITTSLNFLGVPNAIMLSGATPKFVDINPDDLCMDYNSLKQVIGPKTRAIVLVHFNQVADIAPISKLLQEKSLEIPVIQDASLAIGSSLNGLPAGLVDAGKNGATVYSFATSKIITGLGGALVVSNNRTLIERIHSISYQGLDFANIEDQAAFGGNFKMNDLNAAIALEQLKKRDDLFKKRRLLKIWYDTNLEALVKSGKISIQKTSPESIVTHYAVLLPDRKNIAEKLAERGIPIGFWHALHLQKIYQKRFGSNKPSLPVTESIASRIAFLPFHTKLSKKDAAFICRSLTEQI